MKKVGKDGLCHCGSGKRYKKCCGNAATKPEIYLLAPRLFIFDSKRREAETSSNSL
ncbi:MAG: hypothetical protein ACJA1A_001464 [Saprospiraceae bacterium]|jgi:hypothetical protein|tara:strand:- start:60 stop:227 length:168 start_codon:yes stop_codon:yes gene_type:complete